MLFFLIAFPQSLRQCWNVTKYFNTSDKVYLITVKDQLINKEKIFCNNISKFCDVYVLLLVFEIFSFIIITICLQWLIRVLFTWVTYVKWLSLLIYPAAHLCEWGERVSGSPY